MDAKEAMSRIKNHMEVHHMKEEPHCFLITEALQMAINALGSIDQIKWERDIAIGQLKELGLGLGQKIDGVYFQEDEYKKLRDTLLKTNAIMANVENMLQDMKNN